MTSLIDVIFLLLLFFMLSSTFSRFAEVELQTGGTGPTSVAAPENVRFLRITADGVTLNGRPVTADAIAPALLAQRSAGTLLVSVTKGASAQMLTDVLVALRPVPNLTISVLEAS